MLDYDLVATKAGYRPRELSLEIAPDSPEAELIPLIRKIDWDADPTRLQGLKYQLEGWLKVDQMRRGEE